MRREDRDGRKVTYKDIFAQLYQVEQCDWRWTLDVVDEADDEADDDDGDGDNNDDDNGIGDPILFLPPSFSPD